MNEITYWACTSAGRDAVYELEIRETSPGLFHVEGRNGRRGATLTRQIKTQSPVAYAQARSIYDAEVKKRLKKDYQLQRTVNPQAQAQAQATTVPVASAAPAAAPQAAVTPIASPALPVVQLRRNLGVRGMLLTAVDGDEHVEALLKDDAFGLEVKHDGHRKLLVVNALWDGGIVVEAANRDGEETMVPQEAIDALRLTESGRFVLDGELVDNVFHPFDLLVYQGKCIRDRAYTERRTLLANLTAGCTMPVTETHVGETAKRAALVALLASGAEGGVFKRLDAAYAPGRCKDAFKVKFVASATVEVIAVNRKRSVEVAVLHDGAKVSMGNVTIPPNRAVPAVGEHVEVAYLYAYPNGGDFAQPTYKGARDDKTEADAYESLQFKGAERIAA